MKKCLLTAEMLHSLDQQHKAHWDHINVMEPSLTSHNSDAGFSQLLSQTGLAYFNCINYPSLVLIETL
jgi:hypothetical protein